MLRHDSRIGSLEINDTNDYGDQQYTEVTNSDFENVRIGGVNKLKRYKVAPHDSPTSIKAKFES